MLLSLIVASPGELLFPLVENQVSGLHAATLSSFTRAMYGDLCELLANVCATLTRTCPQLLRIFALSSITRLLHTDHSILCSASGSAVSPVHCGPAKLV